MTDLQFDIEITTDGATGKVDAVYFQIRRGKVHETREYAGGAVFADYAKNGELLGIEILDRCRAVIVDQVAAQEPVSVRRRTKEFLRQAGPRTIIAA